MLTKALLVVNIAIFVWSWFTNQSGSDTGLVSQGAFYGPFVKAGEWWRIFTSAFLHGGLLHIASNMFVLWQVGAVVESLFGSVRMALVYLIAIVGAGIAIYTFNFDSVTVGASGAIFGLVGAYGAAGLRLGKHGKDLVRSAFGFTVLNVIIGLALPNISMAGHLGGLAAGLLAGLVLFPAPRFMQPVMLEPEAVTPGAETTPPAGVTQGEGYHNSP